MHTQSEAAGTRRRREERGIPTVYSAASVALGSEHKLLIIRYNPYGYRVGGKTRVESTKDRMARLLDLLEHEPTAFERVFLCYDQDEHATLPQVAASWGVSVQEVSRIA